MTPDQLIRRLGGARAVSERLGLTYQAVWKWTASGKIPAEHYLAMWAWAQHEGVAWRPPGTDGWKLVRDV